MRAATLILVMFLPAAVAAAADDATTATSERPAAVSQAPGAPAQRPAQPAPLPSDRKRRGSLVGYIADATLDNQIRVRFDAGFHSNRPDRAEFFYAQCGCNGGGAPGPNGLVTDLNFQQLSVDGQYALSSRFAGPGTVPLRFIQPQQFFAGSFGDQSGLGDIRAGVKTALLLSENTVVSAQVLGYFQTGDSTKGLGTAHTSIEPALLLYQKLSNRLAIESQVSDWHPIDGTSLKSAAYSGDVLSYGIGPSFELVSTNRIRFAPVVELVGWHVFGGLQVQPPGVVVTADSDVVNLKFGVRTIIDGEHSFYLGYGTALSTAVWYTDIVRFEYRFSF